VIAGSTWRSRRWRSSWDPIGWILIGLGVYAGGITDVGRYAVFDHHFHHGNLPFGPAAAVAETGLWTGTFLVLPLVILLFPDGRRRMSDPATSVGRAWPRPGDWTATRGE
jgi:hypothetical protein